MVRDFTNSHRLYDGVIADLDGRFAVRNRATLELERLGEHAESALREALRGQPSLETQRRIEGVRNTYENYPMISALKETIARRTGDPQWRAVRPPLVELSDEQRSTLAA